MNVSLILVSLVLICCLKLYKSIWCFLRIVKFSMTIEAVSPFELLRQLREGRLLFWFRDIRIKYGNIIGVWLSTDFTVILNDPEDLRYIFSASNYLTLNKSKNYEVLQLWFGKGLLTCGGALWHRKRKMLTPAFHFKILGEFKQDIDLSCDIFIEKLNQKANEETFNIYPFITLLTLDIICETAMGVHVSAQHESSSEYVKAVEDICKILGEKALSPWKRFDFLYRFTKEYKRAKSALKILHDETDRVIQMRKKALQSSDKFNLTENSDEIGEKKRLAFLDLLLLAQAEGAPLTDLDIREEVDTFMFEGHDTTSSALGFAFYLLSIHKVEQQKAYEEAVALEGKEKEPMKYLEAVIKETLRLYPSVPMFSRVVTGDVDIGEMRIPRGTAVAIIPWVIHREEKYFPEPDRFNPERFLVDEGSLHPFAFIAFSAGPRNCIGQKFALLELKCILAKILRSFEILPVEGFEPMPEVTLVCRSKNGIQVRLRKR